MLSACFDWVVQKKNSERLISLLVFESEEKFWLSPKTSMYTTIWK